MANPNDILAKLEADAKRGGHYGRATIPTPVGVIEATATNRNFGYYNGDLRVSFTVDGKRVSRAALAELLSPKSAAAKSSAGLVAMAIEPLKAAALDRAESEARAMIARVEKELRKFGFDLNEAAPRPAYNMERNAAGKMNGKRALFVSVTTWTKATRRQDEPCIVKMSAERCEKFVAEARREAALSFDAYVAKLADKIGEVVSAEIDGRNLWDGSTLTVCKADGTVARWFTRQIVNVSKLGLFFNQWPTRQLKGEAR